MDGAPAMIAVRGRRRIAAALGAFAGGLLAALPAVASADDGLRALDRGADWTAVILLLGLSLAALFLIGSTIYLYLRQRGLHWDYQLPEGALSEGQFVDPDAEHD